MPDIVFQYFGVFILVLVRMSSFFFATPFFGSRNIPMMVKTGLAFFLAVLLTPVVAATDAGQMYVSADLADLLLIILKELMVGITLALASSMIYAAIQVGGMFIDLQMGFAMANVFDPMTGYSSPLTGQFKFTLSMLLFIGLDGHHALLAAMMQSYQFIPVGGFTLTDTLVSVMMQTFGMMFVLGMKIAIPIIGALFLTDLGFAVLSKTVPQMNVFVLGMPAKIIVGILMLAVVMPAFVYILRELFKTMFSQLDTLLRVMGG